MKKTFRLLSALVCAVMLASCLCACGSGKDKDGNSANIIADNPDEHVKLVWYIQQTEPQGFKEVMEEANKQLKEKLNITLDLRCVEPGDYNSKMQLAAASGEEFDLEWTSPYTNNYQTNAIKNAFMDITDYLETDELKYIRNLYRDAIWDACRVNGKIYAVPVEQVIYNQDSILFMEEYMKKYNINPYEKLKSKDDLEDIFDIVQAGEPGLIMTVSDYGIWVEKGTAMPGGWSIDKNGIVTNFTDRPGDRPERDLENSKRMRKWYEKGYFPVDIATLTDTESYYTQGKILTQYQRYLPGVEGKARIRRGYNVNIVPVSNKIIERDSVQSTMTAVSFTSKHPMRALKLLQLLHRDADFLNLICYGIEGRDYTKDPDNPKRMNRDSGAYYISEFKIGSQFLAYLVPSYEDGVWEETKAENEAADIDPNIGFSFDRKPVETEISNVSAVNAEYKGMKYGLYEDVEGTYNERLEKLDKAGMYIIKEEIERQFKEWQESK